MSINSKLEELKELMLDNKCKEAFLLAYNELVKCDKKDKRCTDVFVSIIKSISLMLECEYASEEYRSKNKKELSCFVCGKNENEAELLAGAEGAVCRACATEINNYFQENVQK